MGYNIKEMLNEWYLLYLRFLQEVRKLARPSIFSKDYERRMKKRKISDIGAMLAVNGEKLS